MSYATEVRKLRRRLTEAKSTFEVGWIQDDAQKELRPETFRRFLLEIRHRRETIAKSLDGFTMPPRRERKGRKR